MTPLTTRNLDIQVAPIRSIGLAGSIEATRHSTLSVWFGPPGRCPAEPVRHLVLMDRSASLCATGGNDPVGLRYQALAAAIERVGRACRCDREEVQLISFDTDTRFDTPPTSWRGRHVDDLVDAIATSDTGFGISALSPALDVAQRSMSGFNGRVTLTVISDWLLGDLRSGIQTLDQMRIDQLHVVALTARAPEPFLADESVTVTEIGWDSEVQQLADALYEPLTVYRTPPRHPHKTARTGVRRRFGRARSKGTKQ